MAALTVRGRQGIVEPTGSGDAFCKWAAGGVPVPRAYRTPSGFVITRPRRRSTRAAGIRREGSSFDAYVRNRLLHLRQATDLLEGYQPVSSEAATRAFRILRGISKPSSVFPSIAPDGDGGVSIAWIAGRQTLIIDIEPDGKSGYVRATGPGGALLFEFEFKGEVATKRMAQALDRMSTRVTTLNPGWRDSYAS